jgi:hypothetical protein
MIPKQVNKPLNLGNISAASGYRKSQSPAFPEGFSAPFADHSNHGRPWHRKLHCAGNEC